MACKTRAKKRVAVMPVRVGRLSSELEIPGDLVAARVRDAVENHLAKMPALVTLNRAALSDVVAEQRMANSSLFNPELATKAGRLIPAQFLLYFTVDRIDISTSKRTKKRSEAESFLERAEDLERKAEYLDREAEAAEREARRYDGRARQARGPMGKLSAEQTARSRREFAQSYKDEAASLRSEARAFRTKAARSRSERTETSTTRAKIHLGWRALATSTGAVLESGNEVATGEQQNQGQFEGNQFDSDTHTSGTRHDVLINRILDAAVRKAATRIDATLATEPFRAKVVTVKGKTVILNAGRNLGLGVGDTFGVLKKDDVLTDPDTGLLLSARGEPVGIIRVFAVQDKLSEARIHRAVGTISRGDELEWIGVFNER